MNTNYNEEIVKYIDELVNELNVKYPSMDFQNVRVQAIKAFGSMSGPIEEIKIQIKNAFLNAENNIKNSVQTVPKKEDSFELTREEQMVYEQLKQESIQKRNAMGLNNGKKLVLNRNNYENRGYISLFIILGIVLAVVVSLVVIVCNVLF